VLVDARKGLALVIPDVPSDVLNRFYDSAADPMGDFPKALMRLAQDIADPAAVALTETMISEHPDAKSLRKRYPAILLLERHPLLKVQPPAVRPGATLPSRSQT